MHLSNQKLERSMDQSKKGDQVSHVILMYDGFVELKIRRSNNGAKFTIVSSAFVTSSSSSVRIGKFRGTLALLYKEKLVVQEIRIIIDDVQHS